MSVRTVAVYSVVIALGWISTASAQDACTKLLSIKLPDVTIMEAATVPIGDVRIPSMFGPSRDTSVVLPAHCCVIGSIKPSDDSDIRFEIWLPTTGWNQRYQQVGNGGLAGRILQDQMVGPLLAGAATAGTDDGHESAELFDAEWAVGHPEKLIDYGYRAVHLTALAAEASVQAYYARPARHTYFIGCSDGGRESLMEAQRYPQDFDGYLAGAPGIDIPNNEVGHLHVWQAVHLLGPQDQLTTTQLEMLSARVLERCDALDGLKDGQLRDPRQCRFKAAEVTCRNGFGEPCLTSAQAAAVQSIYDGARDPVTGQQLTPGDFGTMGAEVVTWPGLFLDMPARPAAVSITNRAITTLLYGNPDLDPRSVDVTKAAGDARLKLAPVMNSDNSDLRIARTLGRKVLQYHGWADPNVRPQYSIDYFEAVQKSLQSDTKDFYRLFMIPGMAHCTGGVGPTSLGGESPHRVPRDPEHNWVSALEHWVEDGAAPARMIATEFKLNHPLPPNVVEPPGTPVKRTRPLCPYPQVAVYKKNGSPDDAASFSCAAIQNR